MIITNNTSIMVMVIVITISSLIIRVIRKMVIIISPKMSTNFKFRGHLVFWSA